MLLSRVMNLTSCVAEMKDLLSSEIHNLNSAHQVCTASRMIHIGVWVECPSKEYVTNTVLPLLKKAEESLVALGEDVLEGDERRKVARYANNDRARFRNIKENYLEGKPSAFAPDNQDP